MSDEAPVLGSRGPDGIYVSSNYDQLWLKHRIRTLLEIARINELDFAQACNHARHEFAEKHYTGDDAKSEIVPGGRPEWPEARWFRDQAGIELDSDDFHIYDYDPVDGSIESGGAWVTVQYFVAAPIEPDEPEPPVKRYSFPLVLEAEGRSLEDAWANLQESIQTDGLSECPPDKFTVEGETE